MERSDKALSRFAYLMVVQRGDHDRFRFLSATFRDRPVEVMFDRRTGERRTTERRRLDEEAAQGTAGERRSADRRSDDRRSSQPPSSWDNLGFLIARRELDKEGRG
jgi:hypothetical protein